MPDDLILPPCPCGRAVSSAIRSSGRFEEDGPLTPQMIVLEQCGHVLLAGTPEFEQWSAAAHERMVAHADREKWHAQLRAGGVHG